MNNNKKALEQFGAGLLVGVCSALFIFLLLCAGVMSMGSWDTATLSSSEARGEPQGVDLVTDMELVELFPDAVGDDDLSVAKRNLNLHYSITLASNGVDTVKVNEGDLNVYEEAATNMLRYKYLEACRDEQEVPIDLRILGKEFRIVRAALEAGQLTLPDRIQPRTSLDPNPELPRQLAPFTKSKHAIQDR